MRTSRLMLALAAASLAGCMTYRPRDVIVSVRDAETKAPIAGATVNVSMPHTGEEGKTETTLPNGMARVLFTPTTGEPVMVEATAAGYISDSSVVGEPTVAAVATYPMFGAALPHKPDFTLDLYAGPKFAIEVVLPTGYRGVVRTSFEFRENFAIPKGQRLFSFDANPKGEVAGAGPAILKNVAASDYRARENGLQTPADDPNGLALRWLKSEDGKDVFYYGTKAEFDQYRKDNNIGSSTTPAQSDTKKSGRGGRGGRGGGGGGRGGMGGGAGGGMGGSGGP
jgi:uncharacterized membrane protein YgcG